MRLKIIDAAFYEWRLQPVAQGFTRFSVDFTRFSVDFTRLSVDFTRLSVDLYDFPWIYTTFPLGHRAAKIGDQGLEYVPLYLLGRRNPYFCMR